MQGCVWNDMTPRWQFLCKQYGTKTANKRNLKARKGKDEEGNIIINRQRDTMIKAKKDYYFEYNLFYKPINRGSSEKQYIGTLKYLSYIYYINLNPFSFKVHEINIIEYQALI